MIASAVAGGVIGTLAMATIIKAAGELRLTRMDFALLLGTAKPFAPAGSWAVTASWQLAVCAPAWAVTVTT